LPDGLQTQLGKKFSDGVDLSGGQWQRLALARGFMRTAGEPERQPLLILLDEPTAALDPDTEHALYRRFADATTISRDTGAITLLVSHRFSTVRMADLIVVLHQGRVVETGTHRELINAAGRYAELFELQARAYR
jgi:ATP-binding cassette subfamily B protein